MSLQEALTDEGLQKHADALATQEESRGQISPWPTLGTEQFWAHSPREETHFAVLSGHGICP